jgi:hypothetical protein
MTTRPLIATIAKWAGRVTALLLFLFWGAFFVEHISEWFLRGGGRYPPPRVWVGQALHFCVLAGLALMLKWDKLGATVTVVSTAAFILWIGYPWALTLPLANLIPIALFTVCWLARRS